MKSNIGPTSLISYISFTLIFFIIKNKFKFPGTSWIWFFLIISGILQFSNNLYITNYPEICGSYNTSSALTATLVPWICIFGVTCLCLVNIPGWLRVFSNTFGSSIASMAGMNAIVSKIFDKPANESGTKSESESDIIEATNLLYANRNKFINEVEMDYKEDPSSNIITWPSLFGILDFMKISHDNPEKKKEIKKLYKMLELKEDAGYFVWMILIGSISVLISTNSLILSSCNSVEFNM
jgi:hypothetical protein